LYLLPEILHEGVESHQSHVHCAHAIAHTRKKWLILTFRDRDVRSLKNITVKTQPNLTFNALNLLLDDSHV